MCTWMHIIHFYVLFYYLLSRTKKLTKIQAKEIACENVHLHTIIYMLTTLHSNMTHLASNALLLHYTVHRKTELYARDLVVFTAI